MTKKLLKCGCVLVLMISILFSVKVSAADYTQGVEISGRNTVIWFKSNLNWVDVHYKVNSGAQENLRMSYNSGTTKYEQSVQSAAGSVIEYFFTYNNSTPSYDTSIFTYTGQAAGIKNGRIYRITSKVCGKVLDVNGRHPIWK